MGYLGIIMKLKLKFYYDISFKIQILVLKYRECVRKICFLVKMYIILILIKMCIQYVIVKIEELCIFLSEICFWVVRIYSMLDIGDLGLIRFYCMCCDL